METAQRQAALESMVDRMRDAYNAHKAAELATLFARGGVLQDQAWDERFQGSEAIKQRYEAEFTAAPDIGMHHSNRYFNDRQVVLEATVEGTHKGSWRGLPPTGNRFRITAWIAMTLDPSGTSITELRFDYDRARVLQQLGLLHDLDTTLGKAMTAITHPVTMMRAAARRISERPPTPHA